MVQEKTTVANYLNDKGFSIYHFGFDEKNKEIDENIYLKIERILKKY